MQNSLSNLEKTIEDWSKRPELSESKNMELFKAIHSAQHCQRNYDLSQKMPIEDIKTLVTAATKCPSKQNIKFTNNSNKSTSY